MNNRTNLLEDYVNYVNRSLRDNADFVDVTKEQNKYFKTIIVLLVIIVSLFLFFLLLIYLNEYHFFFRSNLKIGILKANLIMRQYKLHKMAKFVEIKCINPKLKQSEVAKELKISFSTIQRYRGEVNMFSPYRILPSLNTKHTREQKTPNTNLDDVKLASNDLKMSSNEHVKYLKEI